MPDDGRKTTRAERARAKKRRDAITRIAAEAKISRADAADRFAAQMTEDGRWRRICPRCEKAFTAKRSDARFCPDGRCRVAEHRRRRGGDLDATA